MADAEPSIQDLLTAAARAVRGGANKAADYIRGSDFDVLAGVGAMIWSRISQRDTDLFKAVRFGTAEGKDLERLVKKRYGIDRIKDSYGTGTAGFERLTTTASSGTIWAGTRIRLRNADTGLSALYVVAQDTPVAAGQKHVDVRIRAGETGPGWKVSATSNLELVDPIWDMTLLPVTLDCADGLVFEKAADFRTRVRALLLEDRRGHEAAIIDACESAGADRVVLFRSDYGGVDTDHGLNVCYVGGLGYTSSPSLVRACTAAARKARVAGDHLQVLPMTHTDLDITATVYLQDSPSSFDTQALYRANRAAVLRNIGGNDGDFTYTLAGIEAAISDSAEAVQEVVVTSPLVDASIVDASGNFPSSLSRYVVRNVTLNYQPPR
jgi:hypothetical protein